MLRCTHQLLDYADEVNILGGSIHILKENAEALAAATREIGLEVSADKTKYMVMSRDQNAGRIHSVRTDNSTFESVEEFKYLGTTLTNQNYIVCCFVWVWNLVADIAGWQEAEGVWEHGVEENIWT